jgi:hypothetical protein
MTFLRYILTVVLLSVLLGVSIAIHLRGLRFWGPERKNQDGQPQKSVVEILDERQRQAGESLNTPLGKHFREKNWVDFKKLFTPSRDYLQLAELIRAGFIHQLMDHFNSEDHDLLMNSVMDALETIKVEDRGSAALLISQFMRLPCPSPESESGKRLADWLTPKRVNGNRMQDDFLVGLAAFKWGTQSMSPPEKSVLIFSTGFTRSIGSNPSGTWIAGVDQIRSERIRERLIKSLQATFPKLQGTEQNQAYIVLAKNLSHFDTRLLQVGLGWLQTKDPARIEAAVKGLAAVHQKQPLSKPIAEKTVNLLTNLSGDLKTPYSEAKIAEFVSQLRGEDSQKH